MEKPCFCVKLVPNKGLGVLATRKIFMGECIIAEPPLLKFESLMVVGGDGAGGSDGPSLMVEGPSFEDQIEALTPTEKEFFFSLHDCHAPENPTPEGIFRTNAFPMGIQASGLFPNISRINHSCLPNCHHSWNPNTKKETVNATRDIEEGEEIMTTYIQLFGIREDRVETLRKKFFFSCQCKGCTLDSASTEASDIRRKKLSIISGVLAKCARDNCDKTVELVNSAIDLLRSENLSLPRSVYSFSNEAFLACVVHGKVKEAKEWAKKAYDAIVICEGENSINSKKTLAFHKNPTKHPEWIKTKGKKK